MTKTAPRAAMSAPQHPAPKPVDLTPKPERKTWTVREAAAIAGLGQSTIRSYIDRGLMPGRRLGGRTLIPKGLFATWLETFLAGDWKPPE